MRTMLPSDDPPTELRAQQVIRQICEEAAVAADRRCEEFWVNLGKPGASSHNSWSVKLRDSARWNALKADDATLQIAVMTATLDREHWDAPRLLDEQILWKDILSEILRRKLPFEAKHLCQPLQLWLGQPHSLEYEQLPGPAMLGAVERHAKEQDLDSELTSVLVQIRARARKGNWADNRTPNKYLREVADRIDKLLDPTRKLPQGSFASELSAWLATLTADDRESWTALAHLAVEAGDKPKPSGKWLDQARAAIAPIAPTVATERISQWMEETTPDPTQPDSSHDILKGMLWLSTLLDHAALAGHVGRFAEKCFRKIPLVGVRSVKLGNAALWALSKMADEPRGVSELFRIRAKIKHVSARRIIGTYLEEMARNRGETVAALEDLALPRFGLDPDSTLYFKFGDARAEVEVQANTTVQRWSNGVGKSVKSAPINVRAAHAAELAAFKQTAKDLEAARSAQVMRLEQAWIEERRWTLAAWTEHLLEHPLRRPIVESLIWSIDAQAVLAESGALKDVNGRVHAPRKDASVRLWHPLDSQPDQVLAWRRRIVELGITQPIKQAHREIYVLTDAERQTRTYSNRFAAHILRQHQFRALCQARGWKYDLMGSWDGWNIPTRHLPTQGLHVEYHVEVVEDGQRTDSSVALHLASDQVRFLDNQLQPVELEGLNPIVLSEVMRDVDLFVAITSVANDPEWTDGGPEGRHGGYWREWAFGDLGQSAATRKELISWIAPKLSISDKLRIGDKSLIVQGKRQKYAIHLGSGNVQILPSNRYLCIVRDRAPAETANLRLPFAGDGVLSTILAKAFMLVDEDKISDPTILRQL